jgi:solute:Na+ symporter, SSS family
MVPTICFTDYPGFWVFIGASIIGFWYWCTDQHIVQRVLGQRKGEDNDVVMKRARRGTIAAGYFKILPRITTTTVAIRPTIT